MIAEFILEDIYACWASYKGLPFPVNSQPHLPRTKYADHLGAQFDFKKRFSGKAPEENKIYDINGKVLAVPVLLDGKYLGCRINEGSSKEFMLQPMIMVEGSKQIVKTPIVGGKYSGTVKEFINFGDYKVRIYGAVASRDQRDYPVEMVNRLKEMWGKNEALELKCEITDGLFKHVVIENFKLDELKLAPGIQFYEMSCISDTLHEAELLKNDGNASA